MDYRLFEICAKYLITFEQLFFMLRIMSSKSDAEFTWGRIYSYAKGKSKATLSQLSTEYQVLFNNSVHTDWESLIKELVDKGLILDYRVSKPSDIRLKDFEVSDEIINIFFVNDAVKSFDVFVKTYTNNGKTLTIDVNGGKYAVMDKHRDTLFALYERRILQGRDKAREQLSIEIVQKHLRDNGNIPKYKLSNFIEMFDSFVEIYADSASVTKPKRRHL